MLATVIRHRKTKRVIHHARRHVRTARRVAARHHRHALGYAILTHTADCFFAAREIHSWNAAIAVIAAAFTLIAHAAEYCAEK